jgi:hypothetical protein
VAERTFSFVCLPHPYLSPQDEFANFERWDFGNMFNPVVPKQKEMLQYEYARSALGLGLKLENKLGVNPFKFGMIGSTDTHTSLPRSTKTTSSAKCRPRSQAPSGGTRSS